MINMINFNDDDDDDHLPERQSIVDPTANHPDGTDVHSPQQNSSEADKFKN